MKKYYALNKNFIITTTILMILFVIIFYLWLGEYYFYYDDAFITYTYAKHVSSGYGFVFHPESEPIQGSSSFLHTIILAVFSFILPLETHIIGSVLSIFANFFFILVVINLATVANPQITDRVKIYIFATSLFFQQLSWFTGKWTNGNRDIVH